MIACSVLLGSLGVSCGGSGDGPSGPEEGSSGGRPREANSARPRDLPTVRRVHPRDQDELRRRYSGVQGSGIGAADGARRPVRPEDPAHVIVVYLNSWRDWPKGPQSLHGVPLKFVVTGPIRAL